ncbi:MAG TPA: hypothetical protein VFE33_19515 [Thermoanaerobaculia bacterium]|nr:hypothetical protein [Thermoanaerobaculia bacterium]
MISSIARAGGSPATRIFVLTFLLTLAATTGAHAVGATFLDNLDSFNPARWQESDGWTNGGVFNCGWRADHLKFPASMMTLRGSTTPAVQGNAPENLSLRVSTRPSTSTATAGSRPG